MAVRLDMDELAVQVEKSSNARLAKRENPSEYVLEGGEHKLMGLIALQWLGADVDGLLAAAKENLVSDYANSGVAHGFESAKVKVDEFAYMVSQLIESQIGRRK